MKNGYRMAQDGTWWAYKEHDQKEEKPFRAIPWDPDFKMGFWNFINLWRVSCEETRLFTMRHGSKNENMGYSPSYTYPEVD